MEEFASLWSYQENIDELKQKLLYTTLDLEAVKAENDEEMKRSNELMKQLLQSLKIACQERDEAKDQLQKLLNKIPSRPNCYDHVQYHLGPLMIPAKANSSVSESNSLSEAYNHSSSPVDSLFDPISSPEFSNVKVETQFVQDYNQNGGFSNTLNGSVNVQKADQATLVLEGMIKGKTLPQKGSLLKAVLEAGPLLQTLQLAGPLPRWQNPPSLKSFHIPSIVDVGNQNNLLKIPVMMMNQSQPYAKMACGSSSQMMATGGGGGGGGNGNDNDMVLSFGDINFGSNFQRRLVAACPGASYLGTIGKKQRIN